MEVAADTPDPLARREMTEELKRLLECVGRLEPDRQKLVLLAYYNGWSREQLAAKFETPVNTVKTWLRRSMMDIRECLGLEMMAYSEDHIALAAEYALGTLDADERAQVETMMSVDKDFTAMVAGVGAQARRAEPDGRIGRAAARGLGQDQSRDRTFRTAGAAGASRSAAAAGRAVDRAAAPSRPPDSVQRHPTVRQARRWRSVATLDDGDRRGAGRDDRGRSLSAGPAARRLRPKPRTQVVEVKTPPAPAPPSAQYVAVLQKDGGSPAFILTVDGATKNFTVRKVGAAARARQELRALADLRQAAAAAFARRDRRRRLHRASGAGVLRCRHGQRGDLCGDGRAGRRFARRQADSAPVFTGKLIETVPPAATPRAAISRRDNQRYPQKENARGERAFSVVNLGVVGVFYIFTWRLWGAGKEPREFRKISLAHHRACLNW